MNNTARKIVRIVSVIGFIVCSLALLYPVISDAWNRYLSSKTIAQYHETVSGNIKAFDDMFNAALEYNQSMAQAGRKVVTEAEYDTESAYETLLDPNKDGMMGYIEIPCIDVTEAIYHYSTEEVLAKGVGHIHGSSLPVGGKSSHCVLTGHRGLPTQKFFTDLDKVNIGDRFYLHILDKTLAYKVVDIQTVLPTDVDAIQIEDGKDLVTLVTCTPYGVNTHRLLVTGERIPFNESDTGKNGLVTTESHHRVIDPAVYVFAGFMIFILLMLVISMVRRHRT